MSAGKALNAALMGSAINAQAAIVTSQSGTSDSFLLSAQERRTRLVKELSILQEQLIEAKKGRSKTAVNGVIDSITQKKDLIIEVNKEIKELHTWGQYWQKAAQEILDENTKAKILKRAQEMANKHNAQVRLGRDKLPS